MLVDFVIRLHTLQLKKRTFTISCSENGPEKTAIRQLSVGLWTVGRSRTLGWGQGLANQRILFFRYRRQLICKARGRVTMGHLVKEGLGLQCFKRSPRMFQWIGRDHALLAKRQPRLITTGLLGFGQLLSKFSGINVGGAQSQTPEGIRLLRWGGDQEDFANS